MAGDKESSRKHKDRSERRESKKRRRKDEDEYEWTEKAVETIPSAASLDLTSQAQASTSQPPVLPSDAPVATTIGRDDWMLNSDAHALRDGGTFVARAPTRRDVGLGAVDMTEGFGEGDGSGDYFADLGSVRSKAPRADKADPEKPAMSRFEINTGIYDADGKRKDDTPAQAARPPNRPTPGSSGSTWRMAKLRRVQEAAAEETRSIEEVAIERYGTIEAYEEALEERRVLDDQAERTRAAVEGRAAPRGQQGGLGKDEFGRDIRPSAAASPRFLYTSDSSRPSSRQSFRRPGEETPVAQSPAAKASTAVPSVFTPTVARQPSGLSRPPVSADELSKPPLSPTSLNRLQAKLLKAQLMDAPNAAALEAEYEAEVARAQQGDSVGHEQVQVLPTLDGQGRLYDTGLSTGPVSEADRHAQSGSKRRKKEAYVETRDKKTGELLRVNADDDTTTLADLVRQERFGGGSAEQQNMDAELAARISTDNAFQDDLDYLDDNVERLARKKMKTDAQKKMFAVNGTSAILSRVDASRLRSDQARTRDMSILLPGHRDVDGATTSAHRRSRHSHLPRAHSRRASRRRPLPDYPATTSSQLPRG